MTTDEAIQRKWSFSGRKRNLPWYPAPRRDTTRVALAELFGELQFTVGVEVGTRKGDFAKILCAKNPGLTLTCVDPWMAYGGSTQEKQDAIYAHAMAALKGLPVRVFRKPSLDAVDDFDDAILDFVFIDGNHLFDFAMQDIIHWAPKVRKGGIVCVHDYHPFVGADVVMAVNAYTHCHGITPWYVTREREATAFWVQREGR